MIELRWVVQYAVKNGDVVEEKVLQIRVFNPVGCDADGVHHYNGDPANWTAWQDVPTVREE